MISLRRKADALRKMEIEQFAKDFNVNLLITVASTGYIIIFDVAKGIVSTGDSIEKAFNTLKTNYAKKKEQI